MQRNSIVRLFVSKELEAATSSALKEKVFRMHGMHNSVFLLLHSVSPRKMYSCHEPIGKAFMKKNTEAARNLPRKFRDRPKNCFHIITAIAM